MKVGILSLVDYQPGIHSIKERYQQIIDEAVYAEELDFDSFWVGEHHFSRWLSPSAMPLLAAIAQRTSRIRIGAGAALVSVNDPLRLAEDYAMLDQLSDGRVDLVLTRGSWPRAYLAFQHQPSEGFDLLDDAADIIRGAWTTTPFSYDGQYRKVDNIDLQPKPLQQPHPPIFIASRHPEGVEVAAKRGLHLAFTKGPGSPDSYLPLVESFRERLAEFGRDPAQSLVSVGQHVYISDSRERARDEWRNYYTRYAHMGALEFPEELTEGTEFEETGQRMRGVGKLVFEQLVRSALCASAGEAVDVICTLRDTLRADHFWGYFDLGGIETLKLNRSLERFARDVIPYIR